MANHRKLLSEWLAVQESFAQCLHPDLLETHREQKASQLEQVTCLQEGSSFVAWAGGFKEEDTQEPVAALWGWEGELKASLLERSLAEVDGHLMVELASGDPDSRILQDKGFVLERHRLSLTPREHDLETPRQGRYSLRLARELDRVMLCTLAADYAEFTVPPGREELLQQYTASILSRFRTIDFGEESPIDLFVAEENYQSVGYILVELMGDGSMYLEGRWRICLLPTESSLCGVRFQPQIDAPFSLRFVPSDSNPGSKSGFTGGMKSCRRCNIFLIIALLVSNF